MLRFISFLLILGGAAALAFGGYQFMQTQETAALEPAPVEVQMAEIAPEPVVSGSTPTPNSRSLEAPVSGKVNGFDDDMVGVAASTSSVIDSLQSVPIAHETPSKAKFGLPFEVTVAIDATGDDSAADALPGNGNIVENTAQISSTVRASISGSSFDVQPITPVVQRISPLTENIWRWKVTPTAVGSQDLVIELFAMVGDEALPVRTFRDEVQVEVSRIGQAVALAKSVSPITVVAGGIGSLLAGLFGFIGFFRRR